MMDEEYSPLTKGEKKQILLKKVKEIESEIGGRLVSVEAPKRGYLCQSYWGRQWGLRLADFEYWFQRLSRGRTLLRQGQVWSVRVVSGEISGYVGEGTELYHVRILVKLPEEEVREAWLHLISQESLSLLDVLSGQISDHVLNGLLDKECGIFPKPEEIKPICPCLDDADLCSHAAALMYGLGLVLEKEPELIFTLRGISKDVLVETISKYTCESSSINNDLDEESLEDVFGIDLG